jgi:hypothetical protein
MHTTNRFPTFIQLAPLLVLLSLTLFPIGWVGELWPAFGRGIDRAFPTDGWHAIGHAGLFFLLGLAVLMVLPRLRTKPMRYIALLLMIGVGQEFFQMLYKGRLLLFDNSRDLLTDLIGILGAFVVVWAWRRRA